jgi:flagellar hook-basal body complex protein FliE
MPGPILPISSATLPAAVQPAGAEPAGGFEDIFASAVRQVEGIGQQAAGSVERFLSGEGEELHTAILATTRAELSFDLFLQARNKVVSAYQEIMKMQL